LKSDFHIMDDADKECYDLMNGLQNRFVKKQD
jgi:hypothetical protein